MVMASAKLSEVLGKHRRIDTELGASPVTALCSLRVKVDRARVAERGADGNELGLVGRLGDVPRVPALVDPRARGVAFPPNAGEIPNGRPDWSSNSGPIHGSIIDHLVLDLAPNFTENRSHG